MAKEESFPLWIFLMLETHPPNSSMVCCTLPAKSQILTVLSIEPETRSLSPQVKAQLKTSLVCAWKVWWVVNLVKSQRRRVLSQDPEKKWLFEEWTWTQLTKWLCPCKALYGFPTTQSNGWFWSLRSSFLLSKSSFHTMACLSRPPEMSKGAPLWVLPTVKEVTKPLCPIVLSNWINYK